MRVRGTPHCHGPILCCRRSPANRVTAVPVAQPAVSSDHRDSVFHAVHALCHVYSAPLLTSTPVRHPNCLLLHPLPSTSRPTCEDAHTHRSHLPVDLPRTPFPPCCLFTPHPCILVWQADEGGPGLPHPRPAGPRLSARRPGTGRPFCSPSAGLQGATEMPFESHQGRARFKRRPIFQFTDAWHAHAFAKQTVFSVIVITSSWVSSS